MLGAVRVYGDPVKTPATSKLLPDSIMFAELISKIHFCVIINPQINTSCQAYSILHFAQHSNHLSFLNVLLLIVCVVMWLFES